jgi:hypothetical protein
MHNFTNEEIAYLKNFFVSRESCDEKKHSSDEHIQKLELTMTKIGTKLSVMIAILGAIGATMLTVVAKFIFGG